MKLCKKSEVGQNCLNSTKNSSSSFSTLKRLATYLKPHRYIFSLAIFLNILVTVLTVLSMYLMGLAVDHYIVNFNAFKLASLCFILMGLFAFTSIASYAETRIMSILSQKISKKLREELYHHLVFLPLSYFDKHSTGDIMSRMTNDVDNINTTLSESVGSFLEGIINLIGMFFAMFFLSIKLTLWTAFLLPITLLVTRMIIICSRYLYANLQKDLGDFNGFIEEIISAQKMLLLYDQQKSTEKEFQLLNNKLTSSYQRAQAISSTTLFVSFINNLAYLLVAYIGALYIVRDNSLTIGILFTFLLYMRRFARPLNTIASLMYSIQAALAGADRIFSVIDEPIESPCEQKPYHFNGGHIRFENVSFSYDDSQEVLSDISFDVPKGTTLALVGATGSGKTTIANLISRFYEPGNGRILIDEQDSLQLDRHSLRSYIGLVLQDTFLFNDTIYNNIRYAKPDASNDTVLKAAELANADGFIKQLPQGFNTMLSHNGDHLSKGQRQLIALSRAILANTPILILDEATSSIDTQTEKLVQSAIKNLTKDKTTIIIAHRLSTIRNADQILVLNKGRIIEKGDHNSLLAQNGRYAEMCRIQFSYSEG